MRLLIYGMQSSGAPPLAALLAQKPSSAAFVDIWAMYAAPALTGGDDVVAKTVVTTAFPLSLHRERFKPDYTILFLRHPIVNYRSLKTKLYRNHCGFVEEKFAVLDAIYGDASSYDLVLYYEDLLFNTQDTINAIAQLGWVCDRQYFEFPRRPSEIIKFNESRFPEIKGRLEYGFGNYRGHRIEAGLAELRDLSGADSEIARFCPRITRHYRDLMNEKRDVWRLEDPPAARVKPPPQISIEADLLPTVAQTWRLDQIYIDGKYRHLDISIFDLAAAGENWPHVKFKFCVSGDIANLEFRESAGWPMAFTDLPRSEWDSFGLVLRLTANDFAAVRQWQSGRDRTLVQAILTLLPAAIDRVTSDDDTAPADRARWLAEGRAFSKQALGLMRQ